MAVAFRQSPLKQAPLWPLPGFAPGRGTDSTILAGCYRSEHPSQRPTHDRDWGVRPAPAGGAPGSGPRGRSLAGSWWDLDRRFAAHPSGGASGRDASRCAWRQVCAVRTALGLPALPIACRRGRASCSPDQASVPPQGEGPVVPPPAAAYRGPPAAHRRARRVRRRGRSGPSTRWRQGPERPPVTSSSSRPDACGAYDEASLGWGPATAQRTTTSSARSTGVAVSAIGQRSAGRPAGGRRWPSVERMYGSREG